MLSYFLDFLFYLIEHPLLIVTFIGVVFSALVVIERLNKLEYEKQLFASLGLRMIENYERDIFPKQYSGYIEYFRTSEDKSVTPYNCPEYLITCDEFSYLTSTHRAHPRIILPFELNKIYIGGIKRDFPKFKRISARCI